MQAVIFLLNTVRVCVCFPTDPEFVSSAFIKEDPNNPIGEDDKIYFFFTEVAREYDLYTKVKVSRVARVCKVCPLFTLSALM